ncbi:hypothetical protein FACUT_4313 [Fusarium acutatum]|uniref:Uncharacterized protein n=1 Tax=Fusarium acutatum TaxID=78861 RepID=A0A8H4JWH0_9HYPO|nr:hypothetical protein FACUT_4313 [Fusarium acutatum]
MRAHNRTKKHKGLSLALTAGKGGIKCSKNRQISLLQRLYAVAVILAQAPPQASTSAFPRGAFRSGLTDTVQSGFLLTRIELSRLLYEARSQVTADTMEDDKPNYDDCPVEDITDLTIQRQTPKEWLEALTKLDFADPASVINIQFDLAESKTRPAPADEKAPESSPVGQPLPSVVLTLGRLCKGYTTESGILDTHETDYILVVDAITPGHPVWLIWDRLASHEHEHGIYYVHPDERVPVFKEVKKNFDAAQILPSINDWFESYENLDFAQCEESIKATCITGAVQAKESLLSEAEMLLR